MTKVPEGEEWRTMDGARDLYDPAASTAVLQSARDGIRENRQGDVSLRLIDRRGRPLSGLRVEIEQNQPRLPVWRRALGARTPCGATASGKTGRCRAYRERYLEALQRPTNLCYWTERPPQRRLQDRGPAGRNNASKNFAATVDWCLANGLTAKGHPLFWSIDKCTPDWVKTL